MSNLLTPSVFLRNLLALSLLTGSAFYLSACGGGEEPAAVDPAVAYVDEAPAVVEEIVEAITALGVPEGTPETYAYLRLVPDSAQIAVALPPFPGMRDKALPLLRVLNPEENMDEALAEMISGAGEEIGVEAESYEELAAALGVDPNAPLAAFADFSRTVDSAIAAKVAHDAAQPEGATEAPPIIGNGIEAEVDADGLEMSPDTPDHFDDAEEPAWVAVLGLADATVARAALERIADEDESLSGLDKSTETVAGIELSIRGDYGYFIAAPFVALGDATLLRDVAERVSNPANIRYGTAECPATAPDEVAVLVYGNRLMPFLDTALPLMLDDVDDMALPIVLAQIEQYRGMFAEGEDEDPMVVTLSWVDGRLEVLTRVDTEANPGMLEVSGGAEPLRLARYLPENTLAMLSMRFNEVFKKQIMEDYLPAAQGGGGANMAMAAQLIPQIGDELTIGIADVVDGLPGIFILLGLAQPEATQGLLQMFVPMEGGMEHQGYLINSVPVPLPVPVYLSFVDNFAVAGTSESGLKSIIDLHVAKGVSGYFAAMDPPFDVDIPRYQAVNMNTQLLGASLTAMVANFGGDISDSDPIKHRVSRVLREVRMANELEDGWMKGRFTLYFNDLEAVEAALKAEAAEDASEPEDAGAAPAL